MYSWIPFSIFAAIGFATVNIVDKFLLVKYVKSIDTAIKILGVASLGIACFLVVAKPEILTISYWQLLPFASGIFEILYIYLYLLAINQEAVSYLTPFFSMSPLYVIGISTLILGQSVHLISIIGTIVIVLGIILLIQAKEGKIQWRFNQAVVIISISTFFASLHAILLDSSLEHFSIFYLLEDRDNFDYIYSIGDFCQGKISWILSDTNSRSPLRFSSLY